MLVVDIAPELEVIWEPLRHTPSTFHDKQWSSLTPQLMLIQLSLQAHTPPAAALIQTAEVYFRD